MNEFATRLIRWQRAHGRHDLPWQGANAYCVWLSEIMLQQTQVATVIPYYQRFTCSFPSVAELAAASQEEVLAHWSGLGYYARGRNLHRAAQLITERYGCEFPRDFEQIRELPGVGRSTAAAICALAFGERRAILDGNVKRVFARYCGIDGWPGDKRVAAQLWEKAEALLPDSSASGEGNGKSAASDVAVYTQALMDLGATICTRTKPKCGDCPVHGDCFAFNAGRVSELPVPRPRKAVPERHAVMLLLVHGNDVLLERRPGSGIWGGLWCLPQFDDEESARMWFLRSGMPALSGERLAAFTHTFSHFRLRINPLMIQLSGKPLSAAQPGQMWLDIEDALGAAIPAPVRKVLNNSIRRAD